MAKKMTKKELRQYEVELRRSVVMVQTICVDAYTEAEAKKLAPDCEEPGEWIEEDGEGIVVGSVEDIGPA
jgi:hypothetical protein